MHRLITEVLAPVRAAGQAAWQDAITALVAGAMALAGLMLLAAAACVGLVPLLGVAGSLCATGLGFLLVSFGAVLVRLTLRKQQLPPKPEPKPDPMIQLVFDLSFNLGRMLSRRKE